MLQLIKRLGEEMAVKLIAEVAVLALITMGGVKLLILRFDSLIPFKEYVTGGAIVFIGVAFGVLYFRWPKANDRIVIKSLVIRYHFCSPIKIVYTRHYELYIRVPVDRFTDRYRWSGEDKPQMRIIDDGARNGHTIERHDAESLFDHFDISFGRTVSKGETIRTAVEWELRDPKTTSRPFISRSVEEPTEKLVFKLQLPPSWNLETVKVEEAKSVAAKHSVVKSIPWQIDENGKAEWIVPRIKMRHCYQMRWHWPKD